MPTKIWLAANNDTVAGLFIQKIPGDAEEDQDLWSRTTQVAATVKNAELLELNADKLLYRLFNEEEVRLFDSQSIQFACSCSRERTANMIFSLGKSEAQDILRKEKEISVECQFCKADYVFDSVDVEALFH